MFIDIKQEASTSAGGKSWSVRRQPNGVCVTVNDAETTFNRNPVLQSGLTETAAKKLCQEFNAKRGPEYGFDFKGR